MRKDSRNPAREVRLPDDFVPPVASLEPAVERGQQISDHSSPPEPSPTIPPPPPEASALVYDPSKVRCATASPTPEGWRPATTSVVVVPAVPFLDLCPTIWCPVDDCDGYCASDGTSWWCEKCNTTWNRDGENGERQ